MIESDAEPKGRQCFHVWLSPASLIRIPHPRRGYGYGYGYGYEAQRKIYNKKNDDFIFLDFAMGFAEQNLDVLTRPCCDEIVIDKFTS